MIGRAMRSLPFGVVGIVPAASTTTPAGIASRYETASHEAREPRAGSYRQRSLVLFFGRMGAGETLALAFTDDLVVALFDRARELGLLEEEAGVGGEVEAVAEHFGVPPRRVRDWRERGCPATRIGRRLWFRYAEVDEWLARKGPA